MSQIALLFAWRTIQQSSGFELFGIFIFVQGLLDLAVAFALIGNDSAIHRFVSQMASTKLKQIFLEAISIVIIISLIYWFLTKFLIINELKDYLSVGAFATYCVTATIYLITQSVFVGFGHTKNAIILQVSRSFAICILVSIYIYLNKELNVDKIMYILSIANLIGSVSFLFFSTKNLPSRTTINAKDIRTYAMQFWASAIVAYAYLAVFRATFSSQLSASDFGYLMYILTIFNQINAIWTSAFKAILPKVFSKSANVSLGNFKSFTKYLSYLPFLGPFFIYFISKIRMIIGVNIFDYDTFLAVGLLYNFTLSGIIIVFSAHFYKVSSRIEIFKTTVVQTFLNLFVLIALFVYPTTLIAVLIVLLTGIINYISYFFFLAKDLSKDLTSRLFMATCGFGVSLIYAWSWL